MTIVITPLAHTGWYSFTVNRFKIGFYNSKKHPSYAVLSDSLNIWPTTLPPDVSRTKPKNTEWNLAQNHRVKCFIVLNVANNDGQQKEVIIMPSAVHFLWNQWLNATFILHTMVKNTCMIINNLQVRILTVQLTVHSLWVQGSVEATRVLCRPVHHAQLQGISLAENKVHTMYMHN